MKTRILVILVLLSVCVSYASLEPIIVDLPDLTGSYTFSEAKLASFDLGQQIPFEIGAISLLIEGSYSSGVALMDGTEATRDDDFDASFASEIRTGSWPMDVWWASFPPYLTSDFQIECFYEKIGNADWNFLLDGQAEIPLNFARTISWAVVIIEPPQANFTGVVFKIYPIPEPTAILLLGFGGLFLRRTRKCQQKRLQQ